MAGWRRSELKAGVYDEIVSARLDRQLAALGAPFEVYRSALTVSEPISAVLESLLGDGLALALADLKADSAKGLALAEALLAVLRSHAPRVFERDDELRLNAERLTAIVARPAQAPERPRGSLHASSLIVNAEDARLAEVLAMGAWTPVTTFGIDGGYWSARLHGADGSAFTVVRGDHDVGDVRWSLLGRHNVMNALAAIAAADAGGVDARAAVAALADFRSAKRRMELVGSAGGIDVYDDFAHHPTAIATTLAGLRAKVGAARILVGMEPRSNSMRAGAHADELAPSFGDADAVVFLQRPELAWDAQRVTATLGGRGRTAATVTELIALLRDQARAGDRVVFMSNGGFENAPRRFLAALKA